jgi:ribosomal protein S18 acetylase RimI-like enzyme
VKIRIATEADLPALGQLWHAFEAEVPAAAWEDVEAEVELREIAEIVAGEIALVADGEDGSLLGYALARRAGSRLGRLTDLYVVPAARRAGVATALVREAVSRLRELDLEFVRLEVVASNADARVVYARWGFRDDELTLVAPLDALAQRLAPGAGDASVGVVFVQTDDLAAVERAVSAFAPRIGSRGSQVDAAVNGWIAVRDDVASREPATLRRLAKELSDRLGGVVLLLGVESGAVVRLVALERGSVMDEYLSVPEFHGSLPPGDVVALAANPTVLARLTGAEPAAIRGAAPTAAFPGDLPPAPEIAARLVVALGLPPFER